MAKRIHIILIVAIVVASIRLAWILYDRHQAAQVPRAARQGPLNPDYYVLPKKLYPYDLKSAKQLISRPLWVKVGYAYSYYKYDPRSRHVDFSTVSGQLLPLEKLEIKDVVTALSPQDPGERQVLATFVGGAKTYATPIGAEKGGDFRFFSDDMFFIEDPHQLYRHWPAEVWQAIDQHQARPGMSELQADFALGIGLLEPGGDRSERTLDYPNGGHPLTIRFENGKAVEIRSGAPSSRTPSRRVAVDWAERLVGFQNRRAFVCRFLLVGADHALLV